MDLVEFLIPIGCLIMRASNRQGLRQCESSDSMTYTSGSGRAVAPRLCHVMCAPTHMHEYTYDTCTVNAYMHDHIPAYIYTNIFKNAHSHVHVHIVLCTGIHKPPTRICKCIHTREYLSGVSDGDRYFVPHNLPK